MVVDNNNVYVIIFITFLVALLQFHDYYKITYQVSRL